MGPQAPQPQTPQRLPPPHRRQTALHARQRLLMWNGMVVCPFGPLNLYRDSRLSQAVAGVDKQYGLEVVRSNSHTTEVRVCVDKRSTYFVRTNQVQGCNVPGGTRGR